jgi:tetratricopeptide (TPR) repeat protein
MRFSRTFSLAPGLLVLICLSAVACDRSSGSVSAEAVARVTAPAEYVGREACARCHLIETRFWMDSHHDLAMQEATPATVLGDFDNASFTYAGVTSTFYKRDGRFFVRTDGPDGGELQDYPIAYAFGFTPLQQYLIEFPGGRLQTLSICWDTRPVEKGGQRWFHLYPDDEVDHSDPLHWTGPLQNWNYMCSECHSTNVKKNYSSAEDSYQTSWTEIDVSCEACHGPGSRHVEWAKAAELQDPPPDAEHFGLTVRLEDPGRDSWLVNPETGKGMRLAPPVETDEIETCARCHSRRTTLSDDYVFGRPLQDTHRLALLDEALYHADGQILDEVYVYGSFLQSKMYQAGVTCTDCHEPHDQNLRFPGDDVCAPCHAAKETYMVVDPRHDHSLRIPRPDLSLETGAPNACNDCHQDRSIRWAVDTVAKWYGPERRSEPHYGEVLAAARHGEVEAGEGLIALLDDAEIPAIVRATALELLPAYLNPDSLQTVEACLADPDPLVRRAAVGVLESLEPQTRLRLASPLLEDPVRTVRMQAARVLAALPPSQVAGLRRSILDRALAEYEKAQWFNADRAEGRLNQAWLQIQRGELEQAEKEYLAALEMAPWFAATYVNLADLYRAQNREDEGERLLRQGLEKAAGPAELHHALGLLLVRKKRLAEALTELEQAAELRPEWPRYGYVYGVALHSASRTPEALATLKKAHESFPADRETLMGLISISRESGDSRTALRYARKLTQLMPGDRGLSQLVAELESGSGEPG